MTRLLQLVLVLSCLTFTPRVLAEGAPLVAVAANFTPVAEELARRFRETTGKSIMISSGASGTLARQIQRGAPFQLFLSADENYIQVLDHAGLTVDAGRLYALGVLVLYIPYSSGLNRMQDINGLLQELTSGRDLKLALANPDIAPYGRAAREALNRFVRKNRIAGEIIGENAGQAAQYALTGNVDAAFIPWSLALNNNLQEAGHFELIPADWYAPIRQRMVLLKNAGAVAREFYRYLDSDTAKQIIKNFGYALPEQRTGDWELGTEDWGLRTGD